MKLPPDVDLQIKDIFEGLLDYADNLNIENYNNSVYIDAGDFVDLQTRFLFLLNMLSLYQNPLISKVHDQVINLKSLQDTEWETSYSDFTKLLGLIRSMKFSYEKNTFGSLTDIIAASISNDYLGQAEYLLEQNYHVPAAVLIGAVLEDALRRLCQRQTPPIPVDNANGEPKTLNPLIDDLKKANVFNELKAKQLRSWADIRNAAAHGKFDAFTRQDVEQMLAGVQNFLAEYL